MSKAIGRVSDFREDRRDSAVEVCSTPTAVFRLSLAKWVGYASYIWDRWERIVPLEGVSGHASRFAADDIQHIGLRTSLGTLRLRCYELGGFHVASGR